MNYPKVSILMNCYNGEKYLRHAIESVLFQTYKNWEIIFWDNRSTDNSAFILKSYKDNRIKYYLASSFSKLGAARKKAFSKASGELVGFLDVDDIWEKEKLEKQVKYFNDQKIGIVISNVYFFNEYNKIKIFTTPPPSGYVFNELLANYYVCLVSLLVRKSFVDQLKIDFDSDFNHNSDFDLVLRLSKICKLQVCNEVLAGWRVHGKNDTFKSPYSFVEETERWIKKHLETKVLDNKKNRSSIKHLLNRNNRQIAIFELINGNRLNCINKLFKSGNYFSLKNILVFLVAIFPIKSSLIKKLYLKRISKGLI